MTSHYLTCIVEGQFNEVFDALSSAFGNIYTRKHDALSGTRIGIILGEQYFFRVESDVAVLMLLSELSPSETKLEIISWAGGHGLLSISYGAHTDYVHDVRNLLLRSGFRIRSEEEIHYFDGQKCRQLFGE